MNMLSIDPITPHFGILVLAYNLKTKQKGVNEPQRVGLVVEYYGF
jgi:hypothetical protein